MNVGGLDQECSFGNDSLEIGWYSMDSNMDSNVEEANEDRHPSPEPKPKQTPLPQNLPESTQKIDGKEFVLVENNSGDETVENTRSLIERIQDSPVARSMLKFIPSALLIPGGPILGTLAAFGFTWTASDLIDSECRKRLIHEASLFWTQATHDGWWHKVADGLFLSAIPLASQNHHNVLVKTHGIGAVLSLNESHEFEDGFNEPVKDWQWRNLNVKCLRIPAKDYLPLEQSQFDLAVEFIAAMRNQGLNVVVHCKAGRGRSVAASLAYLLLKKEYQTAEDGLGKLKMIRKRINLNEKQRPAIYAFERRLNANEVKINENREFTFEELEKLNSELEKASKD